MLSIILAANIIIFADRIYPGISVANTSLTGLTTIQAQNKLDKVILSRSTKTINLTFRSATASSRFKINLSKYPIKTNVTEVIQKAKDLGHKKLFIPPKNLELAVNFGNAMESDLAKITQEVDQPPISSRLIIDGGKITVTPSQDGFVLDRNRLEKNLKGYLNTTKIPQYLPMKRVHPNLSYENALGIKNRLEKINQTPIQLKFENQIFTLDMPTVLSLLNLEGPENLPLEGNIAGTKFNVTDTKFSLNKQKVNSYFKTLATQIDRSVKEPLFSFDNGKVTQFQPPQEGYKLNIEKSSQVLSKALADQNSSEINLPVEIIKPKDKLVNDLGIKELLGRGISYFAGSIANRAYNVALTASRLNGIIVSPGEVFSFNQAIGDVSGSTGYKQAYIIKSGRTVLDDGGGVCQDSTTLFRAVLNAGLPVVERTAHAYRVGYYEQKFPPGLDATVFAPSVDFKFQNDTPSHILIQAYTVGSTLYVDLYGTSDGRVSFISNPVITNKTPPLPELRQDDPALPKGEVKQVDWPAWGASVVFTRTVTKNGQEPIHETFRSNYRPWQAVFLVGTKE